MQLLVEEDLEFLHAERGKDRAGLLRVGLHPHEHGEQSVGPFVVGGVGGDLVADLALKDPHGQVANVGKMIIKGLTGHAGGARETGDCHLRQGCGCQRVT